MKTAWMFGYLTMGCVVAAGYAQEEFIAPLPQEIPTRPLPATPDPKPTIEGIVAEVFREGAAMATRESAGTKTLRRWTEDDLMGPQ